MYWRIPNVKNIEPGRLFTDEDSFYRFIQSVSGMQYDDLRQACTDFYDKRENEDYLGQIITHLNFSGLLQLDGMGRVETNPFLDYLADHPVWGRAYMNYFLCMWQFPMPNVGDFREDEIHKPYLLILKLLAQLKAVNPREAYLTREDFYYYFLDEGNIHIRLEEIGRDLADEVIGGRGGYPEVDTRKTHYFHALLANSNLLTTDKRQYGGDGHFFIGLAERPYADREIAYLLEAYGGEVFDFDAGRPRTDRRVISDYARYLNCFEKFDRWKEVVMNIRRIEEFYTYCGENGFYYSKELVRRFILSLETKPFVLLTGISGSGKTKIAELWLKFLKERSEAEGILIAVGSNWTDNKKLLGYENLLAEGEERYQETELVRLMREANGDSLKELIVILDEMNLSRVELYFADFLSALESMGHEITLPDGGRVVWTKNIKIVGTVNVDETTYMFSNKVLDRANVIEMNGMPPSEYVEAVRDRAGKPYADLAVYDWFGEYLELLDRVYAAAGNSFAYRVMDEISKYILLNISVCGEGPDLYHAYLDEQINQKVLTRLHGSKSQIKSRLENLAAVLGGEEYPLSSAKLEQMLAQVQQGYTSYIGG